MRGLIPVLNFRPQILEWHFDAPAIVNRELLVWHGAGVVDLSDRLDRTKVRSQVFETAPITIMLSPE
jgi:hypothetical protein